MIKEVMVSIQTDRATQVRQGVQIEVFTLVWMIIEAAASIGAGVVAGSALLIAFGADSVIELVSGATLLWRLTIEARNKDLEQAARAEHRAAWIVAVSLVLLCFYVLTAAIYSLIAHTQPEASVAGIVISAAAVIVMPWLGITKRRLATGLDSGALRGDAASSFTCAYMAAAVLVGVGLDALFHWWWVEPVASLVFLFWLVGETREALEEVQESHERADA